MNSRTSTDSPPPLFDDVIAPTTTQAPDMLVSKQQHRYTFHKRTLHCRRHGGWKEWRRAIRVVTPAQRLPCHILERALRSHSGYQTKDIRMVAPSKQGARFAQAMA